VCAVMLTLNLIMTAIATTLKEMRHDHGPGEVEAPPHGVLDWRVFFLALTVFLYAFSYGGITSFSALYAESHGIAPKSIFLTTLAGVMLITRPLSAPLGDRFRVCGTMELATSVCVDDLGHRRASTMRSRPARSGHTVTDVKPARRA